MAAEEEGGDRSRCDARRGEQGKTKPSVMPAACHLGEALPALDGVSAPDPTDQLDRGRGGCGCIVCCPPRKKIITSRHWQLLFQHVKFERPM